MKRIQIGAAAGTGILPIVCDARAALARSCRCHPFDAAGHSPGGSVDAPAADPCASQTHRGSHRS